MNEKGFIVIDRKMLEWRYASNAIALKIWIHILLKANWKDGYFMGVEVPRGTLATSIGNLAMECKMDRKTIYRWLKRFNENGEITLKSTNRFTLISIVNYAKYQDYKKIEGQQEGQQEGQREGQREGQQEGHNRTINNNINKETNIYSVLEKLKNEDVRKEMMRFIESLKKNGKQMTSSIVEKLIKNLEKLSSNEEEQKEIIKQSEERGWVWFYALKKSNYKARVIPQAEYMKNDCKEEQEDEENEEERNRLIGELKARLQRGEY